MQVKKMQFIYSETITIKKKDDKSTLIKKIKIDHGRIIKNEYKSAVSELSITKEGDIINLSEKSIKSMTISYTNRRLLVRVENSERICYSLDEDDANHVYIGGRSINTILNTVHEFRIGERLLFIQKSVIGNGLLPFEHKAISQYIYLIVYKCLRGRLPRILIHYILWF